MFSDVRRGDAGLVSEWFRKLTSPRRLPPRAPTTRGKSCTEHTVSSTVQEDAIDLVLDEREYQDSRWGNTFDLTNTPEDWCRYIRDYCAGAGRSAGYNFAKRMQKVAALGLAALKICIQKGEDPNDEIFEEPTPRAAAYNAIDTERDYQDAMKVGPDGRTDGLQKSVGDYLTLIRVYSARADEAYSGAPGNEPAVHMIRKVAGIAVQCLEVHGAPRREV